MWIKEQAGKQAVSYRKGNREYGSGLIRGFCPDGSLVGFYNPFGRGKPQPGSVFFVSHKWIEYGVYNVFWNSTSIVCASDNNRILCPFSREKDMSCVTGSFSCIFQKV